jgi:hypothetical protein
MHRSLFPFQRILGAIALIAIGLFISFWLVPRLDHSHFDRYNPTITAMVGGGVFTGAGIMYPFGRRWLTWVGALIGFIIATAFVVDALVNFSV